MTHSEHIPQEELALYAMQALSTQEAAAVRSHLEECAICRDEVAEIAGDLAMVALSVEQHPVPEGARERFMNRISATPRALRNLDNPVVPITSGRRKSSAYSWIPWTAVAALILLTISLGAKIHLLNQELRRASELAARQVAANSHAQDVLDVLTAPAAQRVLLTASKTRPAPAGRAVYLADRGGLIFQANNLDPLPENRTYELWVIPANGKAPIPAGLFRPDATGSASVVLPPLPKGVPAKAFGVTVEQAQGSATPTAPILLSGVAATPGE